MKITKEEILQSMKRDNYVSIDAGNIYFSVRKRLPYDTTRTGSAIDVDPDSNGVYVDFFIEQELSNYNTTWVEIRIEFQETSLKENRVEITDHINRLVKVYENSCPEPFKVENIIEFLFLKIVEELSIIYF